MGVRIDGSNDVVSAVDGTLTVDGLSLNVAGIITASGGFKVGSAVTISSNGNATFSGITTFGDSVHTGIGVSVGIGTDIPEHALVVRDTGLARLRIRNDTASSENYASLNLKTAGFDNGWSVYSEFKSSDADNYLKIFKGDGTATHMYFQDPNEVGIRSAFYHVDANGADQGDSCFGFIANTANPGFKVKSGGTERFRIASDGSVGIGTDNPNRLLHLQAASSTAYSGGSDTADYNFLKIENTTNDKSAGVFFQIGSNGEAAITATEVADGATDIAFQNRGGGVRSEKLRITSGGNLRVGSFGAPSNKNTVTPLAHVDGSGVNGGFQINRHTSVGGGGAQLILSGTRGASITGHTVLQDDDGIGTLVFAGSDGGEFVTGAEIQAVVDGTPGDDDLPTELIFKTNSGGASPTNAMRIDPNQKLLIGGTSARTKWNNSTVNAGLLQVERAGNANAAGICVIANSGTTNNDSALSAAARLLLGRTRGTTVGSNTGIANGDVLGDVSFQGMDGEDFVEAASIQGFVDGSPGSNDMPGRLSFFTTEDAAAAGTERMRLNKTGQLLIGADFSTATASTSVQFRVRNGLGGHIAEFNRTDNVDANNRDMMVFRRGSAGSVGSITCSNSATAFNTSSDYRLKENVALISDGITRVKQLKPSRFNFIVNPGIMVDGFIAHEAATVVPESVSGTHNEVDSENNPVYQGIDQSKLVPLLTAALQEAITKIETLETKVAALEGG